MFKSKPSNQQEEITLDREFRLFQAQPAHKKMPKIREMMQQNRQLTSINVSLYACLENLYYLSCKNQQNRNPMMNVLKLKEFPLARNDTGKAICKLLEKSSKQGQMLNSPQPNFKKTNKMAIENVQKIQNLPMIADKQNEITTKSPSPKTSMSTENKSEKSEEMFNFQQSIITQYNQKLKAISAENEDLKLQIQQKDTENISLHNFKTDLQTELLKLKQIVSLMLHGVKAELNQLSSSIYSLRQSYQQLLSFTTNFLKKQNEQFHNLVRRSREAIEQKKEDKLYEEILNMQYGESYESICRQQILSINDETPLESIRAKIIKDIERNRLKSLTEIALLMKKFKTNDSNYEWPNSQYEMKRFVEKRFSTLVEENNKFKTQNYQQLVKKEPALCFIMSNVLPIFSDPLEAQQITENQHFVIRSLQMYYKKSKKVTEFRYLYGYQRMKEFKINFHCAVDHRPCLLLIIKLKNNVVLGAYCERGLSSTGSNPSNRGNGYIFECKNKKTYDVRPKYKNSSIMPYDPYFILVGNYDIKIRVDSDQLQSCFSSESSLFRPTSQYTSDSLLFCGSEVSTTELIDYQFYEVVFS